VSSRRSGEHIADKFQGAGVRGTRAKVQFAAGTTRAMTNGQPLVTASSVGHCLAANGALGGPVVVTGGDPRVQAS
jgi:hypothetical protein